TERDCQGSWGPSCAIPRWERASVSGNARASLGERCMECLRKRREQLARPCEFDLPFGDESVCGRRFRERGPEPRAGEGEIRIVGAPGCGIHAVGCDRRV